MNKKQTAVEYLKQQFALRMGGLWHEDFEQALQMEREQIEEAYKQGIHNALHIPVCDHTPNSSAYLHPNLL